MFQKLGSKILTGKGLGLLGGAGAAAFAGTRCVNSVLLIAECEYYFVIRKTLLYNHLEFLSYLLLNTLLYIIIDLNCQAQVQVPIPSPDSPQVRTPKY